LKNATDYDHRVRPHDIDDDLPAKLGEIVRSYYGVFITGQDIVKSRLVFYEIVDTGAVFQRPLHVSYQARQGESFALAGIKYFLDQSKHFILIKVAVAAIPAVIVIYTAWTILGGVLSPVFHL